MYSSKIKNYLNFSINDNCVANKLLHKLEITKTRLYIILNSIYIFEKFKCNNNMYVDKYLLFTTCIILSSKLFMDISYTNQSWTEIFPFDCKQISSLELTILEKLDYKIYLPFKNMELLYFEYGKKEDIDWLIANNIPTKKKKDMFFIFKKFLKCIKII
ncbi:hypothetical protein NAPIS_ORF02253 [Vairimorpha apis BRL 01]|uniref:Uncharacterized protein n=1 Tax=Vairimorpha apis BRL 01 TaxID=1037528 RepID=T0L6P8_9MICR|nr:hypothetical protein NAPIS_ORF02253 [Vairimorpha apis BRL 01]